MVVNVLLRCVLAKTGREPAGESTNTSAFSSSSWRSFVHPLFHMTYGKVRTWFLWLVTDIDADVELSFRAILILSSSSSLLILGRSRAAIRILCDVAPGTMLEWRKSVRRLEEQREGGTRERVGL